MSTNILNPVSPQLIVQNYFNLVQAIANRIKRRLPAHVDVEDLVQTGMIGLLEASSRYDASRAVDFSSYANSRITGAILDELRKWDTCSRQDRKVARQIEDAKQRLRAGNGEEPTIDQIAEAVGMALEEYDRALHRLESSKQPSGPRCSSGGKAGTSPSPALSAGGVAYQRVSSGHADPPAISGGSNSLSRPATKITCMR